MTAKSEMTREDAEARLYHLEGRLAELGFDHVTRQGGNTAATAADNEALDDLIADLTRLEEMLVSLLNNKDLDDYFARALTEVDQMFDNAYWLLDKMTEGIDEVRIAYEAS